MDFDGDDDDDDLFEDAEAEQQSQADDATKPEDADLQDEDEMDVDDDREGDDDEDREGDGDEDEDGDLDMDEDNDNDREMENDEGNEDNSKDSNTQLKDKRTNEKDGETQTNMARTPQSQSQASSSSRRASADLSTKLGFKQSHTIVPSREILEATSMDILPTTAMLHACPIYSMAFSWGMKWMFTGGYDGFIRKYNFAESVNGKILLTVAQRHPFVDSVTKAGVLAGYWENEQPFLESDPKRPKRGADGLYEPVLSPVHSLAVQSEALWLLSGLESGGITLQTVRHDEGSIHAYLNKHTSAVSCLMLDADEQSVLSGSWDKSVLLWDLNTGQYVREFEGCTGQLSSLEWQPEGGIVVEASRANLATASPKVAKKVEVKSEQDTTSTFLGSNDGTSQAQDNGNDNDNEKEEDMDSLFGSDEEEEEAPQDSKGVKDTSPSSDIDRQIDQEADRNASTPLDTKEEDTNVRNDEVEIEHDKENENQTIENDTQNEPKQALSHSTFLTSCIDGAVDIWDKRQRNKIGRLSVPSGTPPWSMSACWSADGNRIYVGRRNATVDEYDLRASLTAPQRTFKFPSVSGPVSSVRALPNGRHLLCASNDNIRLYDLKTSSKVPFFIIPGHHGACISSMYVDPGCNYMISASGNRGWQGTSTDVALVYEIHPGL